MMKKHTMALCTAIYLLAVMLVFSALSIFSTVNTVDSPSPEEGVIDLTNIDFNEDIVTVIPTFFSLYPDTFYTSEDFAFGSVMQEGIPYTDGDADEYGTVRLELRLPPGEVYSISGTSAFYAHRLFVDGKEKMSIGVPSERADTAIPQSKRYITSFQPAGETTEIIIHYSAFVHADGGYLPQFELGLMQNVTQMEQLRTFRIAAVTGVLVTTVLFFFGLFLFFQKSRYLLWFSLACLFVGLRGMLTGDKVLLLLLPNLDWYLAIRLEYLANCGVALFSALYLSRLFPGAVNRHAMGGFIAYCIANVLFIFLAPPLVFTRFVNSLFVGAYAVFGIYLLMAILTAILRKKLQTPLSSIEQILLLCGLGIFITFSALGVYTHQNANMLFGLDYPQVGMMAFLFIHILVLALGFTRIEQKLDEVRQSEREMEATNRILERLDRLRSDFLANISHEMRTPLMIMSGFAHLAKWDIEDGSADEDTLGNLDVISQEAERLAQLSSGLLRVSADAMLERSMVSLATIFERVTTTCTPILAKHNNQMKTNIENELPTVQVNEDMILQVLLNLIVNANRHTEDGVITLHAQSMSGNEQLAGGIAISVQDSGKGIVPELLPHVFERHMSGDGSHGLGLAICKEIVEEHGGSITIESTPGSGTCVTFTMPLNTEEKNNEADNPTD